MRWVVVWETDDGPSVDGVFESEEEALEAAYKEWCDWAGGVVGGYSEGTREEFIRVYAESDKVWVIPMHVRSDELAQAAREFLDTMGMRHSDIYGREVPGGFTKGSGKAALKIFDVLQRRGG